MKRDKYKKEIFGWALYDWANSAFATTVMAGFFPIFFKQYLSSGVDVNLSTARLGIGNSIAGILVAATAPVLGAMADISSAKKRFMSLFAFFGAAFTGALYFMDKGQWMAAVLVYSLAVFGFSSANTFYDALLPEITDEKRIDFVSGLGFSLGYLGGGLLFLVNVIMVQKPHLFGLSSSADAVKLSFLTVALWWIIFTIISLSMMKKEKNILVHKGIVKIAAEAFASFFNTIRRIRRAKNVFIFLMAYWLYIDGVNTIIKMAVDYGMSIGFSTGDLIGALLMVQFIGFPAALAFGKLGQAWNTKKAIYVAIFFYTGITVWGTMISKRHEFYILAGMIGLVQGGIQSLSRSFYARLIPEEKSAEFFGFYNMVGKFSVILGPALIGLVGLAVRHILMPASPGILEIERVGRIASRAGIGSILVFFIFGALLLGFVKDETKDF